MARLYDADPDEVIVDIAKLELRLPSAIDAATSLLAGGLRCRHYHRTTRAVSMSGCVLAAIATGEPVATSDPHLLDMCHNEGITVVPMPDSDGSVWSPP